MLEHFTFGLEAEMNPKCTSLLVAGQDRANIAGIRIGMAEKGRDGGGGYMYRLLSVALVRLHMCVRVRAVSWIHAKHIP